MFILKGILLTIFITGSVSIFGMDIERGSKRQRTQGAGITNITQALPSDITAYILSLTGSDLKEVVKSTVAFLKTNKAHWELRNDHQFLNSLGSALAKKTGKSRYDAFREMTFIGLPEARMLAMQEQ